MDSIVKKLSEIETAATAIVEHAEAQKSDLDKEYEEARKKFDDELEANTQAKISAIRSELEKKTTTVLNSQTGENSDSITALKKEYEQNHTFHAKQILKRITEV